MVSSLQRAGADFQRRNPWRPVSASRRIVGGGHPGLELLRTEPVFWVDAAMSPVVGGKLSNLGTGGSALDAQFGSTTGSDTNDPTMLPHTGTNYLYLPGVIGNGSQVPDEAALDITGDIEIIRRVAMDDWTPSSNQSLVGKFGAAGNRSWRLYVNGAGQPVFETSPDGTTLLASTATAALGATDGEVLWVRVVFDADDGAGNRVATFYRAADQPTEPTSWTQVGAVVTTVGATSIFNSTDPLVIGARGAGAASEAMAGADYRCIVKATPLGTPTTVLDVDFTRGITSGGQTSFTCTTGQTVTINRATSGRKAVAVTRPVILLGTDDYFEVPDNALLNFGATDSFTALLVVRQWATAQISGLYLSKRGLSGAGYLIASNGTAFGSFFQIEGAALDTANQASGTAGAGSLALLGGVRNTTADTIVAYLNGTPSAGTTDPTTTSLANALPMRIGSRASSVTQTQDFEFVAAAVFRRALTAAEISGIVSWYGAS